jgi:hypothetical protein
MTTSPDQRRDVERRGVGDLTRSPRECEEGFTRPVGVGNADVTAPGER